MKYLRPKEILFLEAFEPHHEDVLALWEDLEVGVILEHHHLDFLFVCLEVDPGHVLFVVDFGQAQQPPGFVRGDGFSLRVEQEAAKFELQAFGFLDLHDMLSLIEFYKMNQYSLLLLR